MDKATADRYCSLNEQKSGSESLSKMSYLILLMMMSVRRIQNQLVGSSTNIQGPNVGVDCSAGDREWELYGVDGLLNYGLYFVLS